MPDDVIKTVLERVQHEITSIVAPKGVLAFLSAVGLDRMEYMNETDHPDVGNLPTSINPIICPGGSSYCGTDMLRVLAVDRQLPEKLRSRLERAIEAWVTEMDAIASDAGEGRIQLQVAVAFQESGPELTLGYAGPGHEHVLQGRARALAARDGVEFRAKDGLGHAHAGSPDVHTA